MGFRPPPADAPSSTPPPIRLAPRPHTSSEWLARPSTPPRRRRPINATGSPLRVAPHVRREWLAPPPSRPGAPPGEVIRVTQKYYGARQRCAGITTVTSCDHSVTDGPASREATAKSRYGNV